MFFAGKMHAVPASLKGKYVIRFTVTSPRTTLHDLARDWELIQTFANEILGVEGQVPTKAKVSLKEIREKNPQFGTSLLLANSGPNSHISPKIVNGSFAALFDTTDVIQDFSKRLQILRDESKDSGKKIWIF
jgi:histidine decarboxylase